MRKKGKITEKPVLDLIEDTVALLRECPVSVLALYYAGAVPFVLGFLFFWADISRGAFAREHVVESSLLLALEFVWCKCWQSLFAVHLLAIASHRTLPRWTLQRVWRLATAQAAIQATGLFVLPVAALLTVPFGFAYAFYQNASILALDGDGELAEGGALRREAVGQARRWTAQNQFGLAVLNFFSLVVFANLLIVIVSLPMLLKTLFGIETMFSRSLWSMFNTTLFTAAGGIAYLCVDPLFKAFYTLRCFHGRSLANGENLRIALRAFTAGSLARTVAAVLLLLACATMSHGAEPAASPGIPAQSAEINEAIAKVLSRPEFAWRLPREKAAPDEGRKGFMDGVVDMLRRWLRPMKQWIIDFFEWLGRWMRGQNTEEPAGGGRGGWGALLTLFAWAFCACAACALAVIGWKLWMRRGTPARVMAAPVQARPDLTAEDVAADQLPEDAWLNMAREMIERGELRLALRAFYLAALAHLSERQFIAIARYKSNRDYQRELRRRRPGETDLNATFEDTVAAFERAWYGMHEVTGEILNASQTNLERIRQS